MRQPADDDRGMILRKPPHLLVWAIAVPALLVVLGAAGGWLLWQPSPPETRRQIVLPPAPTAVANPETDQAADTLPAGPPAEISTGLSTGLSTGPSTETATAIPVLASPPQPAANAVPESAPDSVIPTLAVHIESANEQHMLDHVETGGAQEITVFRFKPNPRILVLDFASLREQGRMLNRAAALVEKTGLPRDRLLGDAELERAVRDAGDTVETFYYGHDYGAASLVRFFWLADHENIQLTNEELSLHRLLTQEGWFGPNTRAGLITIPQVGADEHVTKRARATILHHELSHGEYFTNPAYVAFVHHFWKQTLTEAEREQIKTRLRFLGYDSAQDDLMENEAQAYLMFTDDAEFFTPDMVGMSIGRLAELRTGFYRSMPAGWLRDSLGLTLGVNETAAAHR
jgi:hypothetical protein